MRAAPVLGRLALAAAGLALALTLAEVVVRVADLDFRPIRSRANEDAVLEQLEFRTRVVTNALGFRDRRLPGPKPPGTMRVVVLGDSFTQGYGVEEEQAYPRRLERLLDTREPARRHEVVNLGVPGACPLDYVAHLRDVGLGYDPDLVLVGLMANDVNDIRSQREFGGRILAQILRQVQDDVGDARPAWKRLPQRLWPSLYEYVGNRLRAHSLRNATAHAKTESAAAVPTAVSDGRWREVLLELAARYGRRTDVDAALAHAPPEKLEAMRPVLTGRYRYDGKESQLPLLHLTAFLQPQGAARILTLPPEYDAAWAEMTRTLRRLDELARNAGARTMIAFLPAVVQVSPQAVAVRERLGFEAEASLLTDTTMTDRLRAFGAEAGIPVVDLLPPLRARRDEALYYPIDGHWTALGHEVAAEALAAAIPRG